MQLSTIVKRKKEKDEEKKKSIFEIGDTIRVSRSENDIKRERERDRKRIHRYRIAVALNGFARARLHHGDYSCKNHIYNSANSFQPMH